MIIKVNYNGNVIWKKEILSLNQENEIAYSIDFSNDGGYYICSSINSLNNQNTFKPKIIKIDGLGNIDWQRIINTNSLEYHQFRISSTKNGSIILAGTSINNSTTTGKSDAFVYRLNSEEKFYGLIPTEPMMKMIGVGMLLKNQMEI